jgi:hypothetical protein
MMRATPGLGRFMEVYRPALQAAVEAHPAEYALGLMLDPGGLNHVPETAAAYADRTARKMEWAFASGNYNHDGHAIKAACKALGIKHTRKAIEAFLTGATT